MLQIMDCVTLRMCGIMANLVLNFRNKDVENIYMEIWQNEFGLAPG